MAIKSYSMKFQKRLAQIHIQVIESLLLDRMDQARLLFYGY